MKRFTPLLASFLAFAVSAAACAAQDMDRSFVEAFRAMHAAASEKSQDFKASSLRGSEDASFGASSSLENIEEAAGWLKNLEIQTVGIYSEVGDVRSAVGSVGGSCDSDRTSERQERACRHLRQEARGLSSSLERLLYDIRSSERSIQLITDQLIPGDAALREAAGRLADNAERLDSSARGAAAQAGSAGDELKRISGLRSEGQIIERISEDMPDAGEALTRAARRLWSKTFEPLPNDPTEEPLPSFPVRDAVKRMKELGQGLSSISAGIQKTESAMANVGSCDRDSRAEPAQAERCRRLDENVDSLISLVDRFNETGFALNGELADLWKSVSTNEPGLRPTAKILYAEAEKLRPQAKEAGAGLEDVFSKRLKEIRGYTSKGNLLKFGGRSMQHVGGNLAETASYLLRKISGGWAVP